MQPYLRLNRYDDSGGLKSRSLSMPDAMTLVTLVGDRQQTRSKS